MTSSRVRFFDKPLKSLSPVGVKGSVSIAIAKPLSRSVVRSFGRSFRFAGYTGSTQLPPSLPLSLTRYIDVKNETFGYRPLKLLR